MSTITLRSVKGSPLTNNEVDANFSNLNNDKIETATSNDGSVILSRVGTAVDFSVNPSASTSNLIAQVRNETGSTLLKGTIVYSAGASGNKMLVERALATSDTTSAQTFGMVQADIPNNQNGYVVVSGIVSGLDTSGLTEGGIIYLSSTVPGGYTQTKPYAPNHLVYAGIVTRVHATQGTIQARIQNGYELDEIHDVAAVGASQNDFLVRNGSNLWVNTAPAAARTAMDVDQAGTAVAMAIALG
jgi:ribosomal protein L35AE/L33A